MKKLLIICLFLSATTATAKLLDKVAGVINDKIYTLSELERVKKTISARKEISPFIYVSKKFTTKDILKKEIEIFIVKDKLSAMGFVISDDSVESRIKETEKRLGLRRADLLDFLATKNIDFNEYFELIRQAMEFNIFNRRVISPLVNITEQEVKNHYYKMNKSNKALSFNYHPVDFTFQESKVLKSDRKRLGSILEAYQRTGNLPQIYRDMETNDLGNVSDEDLPKELSIILKATDEGAFSKLFVKSGVIHIFYLKKKDLTESQDFLKRKAFIKNKIYMTRSKSITKTWFNREALNYYILENI